MNYSKYAMLIMAMIVLMLTGCSDSDNDSGSSSSSAIHSNGLDTAYIFTGWGDTTVNQTATDLEISVTISSGGGNAYPNTNDFSTVVSVINQDGTTLHSTITRISALGPGGKHTFNISIPLTSITGAYVTLGVQADIFEEVVLKESDWRILSSFTRQLSIPYPG